MNEEKLFEILTQSIEQGLECAELIHVLTQFKDQGGLQATAQEIAEQLKIHFKNHENFEERVLELSDIIWGWCQPHHKIW